MEPLKIPKKVNRHVIKAIDFLQTSRTDFVHIDSIQEQVKRSLRHTKPVSNLDVIIRESLRKQTALGIVSRSGSSMFGMTLAFQGLRADRNVHKIKKNEAHKRTINSLTVDEIASVRKILRGVQKPLVKTKSGPLTRALFKRKSIRNVLVRSKKPAEKSTPIIYDKFGTIIENLNIPKKVNRHVFKAMRYFTNNESYEFVPLDKIKMEVKWSMKNLKPLRDLGAVIERSLTNLSNMGVLAEHHGSYRLNPVQSLPADSSYVIFGKVSQLFFQEAPIYEPILTDSYTSRDSFASSSHLEGQFFPLTSDSDVGNAFSVPMVISEPSSQEIQGVDQLQNVSYMERREMHLDEGMSDDSQFSVAQGSMQSSIKAEQTSPLCPMITNSRASEGVIGEEPNVENASSIELGPFLASVSSEDSQEKQGISYMEASELPLDEPVSDHSSTLVPKIRNFGSAEGAFGVQPENATSIVQLPRMASENISQEMHNPHTGASNFIPSGT